MQLALSFSCLPSTNPRLRVPISKPRNIPKTPRRLQRLWRFIIRIYVPSVVVTHSFGFDTIC